MRIKQDFVLRRVGGSMVAVTSGGAEGEFRGMIQLNPSGVFIWECLQEDITKECILNRLMERYDIDRQSAGKDLDALLNRFREYGILMEP